MALVITGAELYRAADHVTAGLTRRGEREESVHEDQI